MNKQDELVILHTYDSELEADMAKELLNSNDLLSFIIKEDPTSMGLQRRASINVLRKDVSKAKILLGLA